MLRWHAQTERSIGPKKKVATGFGHSPWVWHQQSACDATDITGISGPLAQRVLLHLFK